MFDNQTQTLYICKYTLQKTKRRVKIKMRMGTHGLAFELVPSTNQKVAKQLRQVDKMLSVL